MSEVEAKPFYISASLASIGRRVLARLTDGLILLPILGISYVLNSATSASAPVIAWALLGAGLTAAYEVALIATRGQTLGKMAFKLRVVVANDGSVPGWERAAARLALPVAVEGAVAVLWRGGGVLTGLLTLVIYLWAARDRFRQGLHDKAAGTIVVRTGSALAIE